MGLEISLFGFDGGSATGSWANCWIASTASACGSRCRLPIWPEAIGKSACYCGWPRRLARSCLKAPGVAHPCHRQPCTMKGKGRCIMCCGNGREQLRETSLQAQEPGAGSGRASVAYFEYIGPTNLAVVGPVTGWLYRFNRPGDRVLVDLRDRPSLAAVPHLREIINSA